MPNETFAATPVNTSNDKYMATVKVGSKGQIAIPKEVRDLCKITSGDVLLLQADVEERLVIQPFYMMKDLLMIYSNKTPGWFNDGIRKGMRYELFESRRADEKVSCVYPTKCFVHAGARQNNGIDRQERGG